MLKKEKMIELLSPAGDLDRLKFAFMYGADAVYIGGFNYSLRANAKNFNNEEIKEYIESFGYTLLSKEYKNNKTELKIQCNDCGKIFYMRFNNFKDGKHRCECKSKPLVLTYEYVKSYIESYGYQLLSKEYKNNSTYLLVWCGPSFYFF